MYRTHTDVIVVFSSLSKRRIVMTTALIQQQQLLQHKSCFSFYAKHLLLKKIGAFSGVSFFLVGALGFLLVAVEEERDAMGALLLVMVCIVRVLRRAQKIMSLSSGLLSCLPRCFFTEMGLNSLEVTVCTRTSLACPSFADSSSSMGYAWRVYS